MKRQIAFFLALVLVFGMMTGCSKTAEKAEPAVPQEPSELIVLRNTDDEMRNDYTMLAVSGSSNTAGTDALIQWLTSIDSLRLIDSFGVEEYGDRVIFIQQDIPIYSGDIAPATEDTKVIQLATTAFFRDQGLLDVLLPAFEEACGYEVEVFAGTTDEVLAADADLLILHDEAKETEFVENGFARVAEGFETERIPFVYNHFLLCGPSSDPAGVMTAETAADAFFSITAGEYPFISRGDGSSVHVEELLHWPEPLGITADSESFERYEAWYISAGADMRTCLDLARAKGAYILTDKATFLLFQAEHAVAAE